MTGWKRIFNEPVALGSLIRSGIALAVAFGFNVTAEQTALLIVFVEAVAGVVTRTFVTPNHLAEARVARGDSPTNQDPPPPLTAESRGLISKDLR